MYYEEKIINGVLCWRGMPDGLWTPFNVVELTTKLKESRDVLEAYRAELRACQTKSGAYSEINTIASE